MTTHTDIIPTDPFHDLVMRRWGVDVTPVSPDYVKTLGTYSLSIRRYDEHGARVTRGFQLYGNDLDDLLTRAADIALRIEQGRPTGVPGSTFVLTAWIPDGDDPGQL